MFDYLLDYSINFRICSCLAQCTMRMPIYCQQLLFLMC